MDAKIIIRKDMYQLRNGRKGTGKRLFSASFWCNSSKSESLAIQYCMQEAVKLGINRVFQDDSCGEEYCKLLCINEFGEKVYIENELLVDWLQLHEDRKTI